MRVAFSFSITTSTASARSSRRTTPVFPLPSRFTIIHTAKRCSDFCSTFSTNSSTSLGPHGFGSANIAEDSGGTTTDRSQSQPTCSTRSEVRQERLLRQ